MSDPTQAVLDAIERHARAKYPDAHCRLAYEVGMLRALVRDLAALKPSQLQEFSLKTWEDFYNKQTSVLEKMR